jgi:DinB superfamily
MPMTVFDRPSAGENAEYYDSYISLVPPGDLLVVMSDQVMALDTLLRPLSESAAAHRSAPGKWSVKQVVGHLIDTERVFSFRAIAFARNEVARLPSFDQDAWVAAADYDARTLASLLDEFAAARRASLSMIRGLPGAALLRRGVASDVEFTVRATLCILPGHVEYHLVRLRGQF